MFYCPATKGECERDDCVGARCSLVISPQAYEAERRRVQRAQLADMPWDVIEAWLMEQGYVIVSRDWHRSTVQRLAPIEVLTGEWPPMAGEGRDG